MAYEVLWVSERLKIYNHEKKIWKIVYSGNNPISIFSNCLLVFTKLLQWEEDCALSYNSIQLWDLSKIS